MYSSVLGLALLLLGQDTQPAQAPANPDFEIVETKPAAAGKPGRNSRSSIVRTSGRPSADGKPIKIKTDKVKGVPKFRKPSGSQAKAFKTKAQTKAK